MRTVIRYTIVNQNGQPVIRAVPVVCPNERPVAPTNKAVESERRTVLHRPSGTLRLRSREYDTTGDE